MTWQSKVTELKGELQQMETKLQDVHVDHSDAEGGQQADQAKDMYAIDGMIEAEEMRVIRARRALLFTQQFMDSIKVRGSRTS
jgi:hypothetical protein